MKYALPDRVPLSACVLLAPLFIAPVILHLGPALFDDTVHGWHDPKFAGVYEAFRRNFGEGMEREGAAVAVYHRGRRVVDLWGGWADSESERRWKRDTTSVMFSATKAVSALVIAHMVDRGLADYSDRVAAHWPEYGQNGKNDTTIDHVLAHQAGLPYIDAPIDYHDVSGGSEQVLRDLESAAPIWQPGEESGYHAVTYGWIVDGLVRKVDPLGRDLATYFREEIAERYDLDVTIGSDPSNFHRQARLTQPGLLEYAREIVRNFRVIIMLGLMYIRPFDTILAGIRGNPDWMPLNYDTVSLNDPSIVSLSLGAVSGVGTAESFARMFALALDGTIISNRTVAQLHRPTLDTWHVEQVVLYPVYKGRGFFYDPHPLYSDRFVFGHPGYGGQFVMVDPHSELVVAYLANGLKTSTGELCAPFMRLRHAAFQAVQAL